MRNLAFAEGMGTKIFRSARSMNATSVAETAHKEEFPCLMLDHCRWWGGHPPPVIHRTNKKNRYEISGQNIVIRNPNICGKVGTPLGHLLLRMPEGDISTGVVNGGYQANKHHPLENAFPMLAFCLTLTLVWPGLSDMGMDMDVDMDMGYTHCPRAQMPKINALVGQGWTPMASVMLEVAITNTFGSRRSWSNCVSNALTTC